MPTDPEGLPGERNNKAVMMYGDDVSINYMYEPQFKFTIIVS